MDIETISQRQQALYPVIRYGYPELWEMPQGGVLGSYTISLPHVVRHVFDPRVLVAPATTPQDVARALVRDAYKLPIRRRRTQETFDTQTPLYALPGTYSGDYAYVDIKSTYRRFLQLVGFDVDYKPMGYIAARGWPLASWVPKISYSSIVAMARHYENTLLTWHGCSWMRRRERNTFFNPCLPHLVADTLAAVYGDVLDECRPVYANCDGYIVPLAQADRVIDIAARYGLVARIKAIGPAIIYGVASYRVGDYASKLRRPSSMHATLPVDKQLRRWLAARLTKFASCATLD